MKILVLALGNDLFGDDAVGFLVAENLIRLLSDISMRDSVEILKSHETGFKLLDYIISDYDHVILVDSILGEEPGRIVKASPESFKKTIAFSPHYSGIPEVLELLEELDVKTPEVEIYAIEIKNTELGSSMSEEVLNSAIELARILKSRIVQLLSKKRNRY